MARPKQIGLNLETVVRWASTLSQSKLWELINALLALAEAVEDSDRSLSTNGSNGGGNGSGRLGGYVELKMINGCGPYRYLRFRSQGQYKSVYLGKAESD
ncbi:hypothetical protein [Planktothrix pseudagardhii]|uniref:Uncharacterized protein n=1 Tax=Planktothrix pseudagardhii TaxID=132604 RepID=A0A9W4CUD8_9CYAN|nr:hypothetical protein [Planktothrix pseudagardhii]CAD5988605.1 hypothetical protein NO713_05747 [Planktothrix pseudagardhii]